MWGEIPNKIRTTPRDHLPPIARIYGKIFYFFADRFESGLYKLGSLSPLALPPLYQVVGYKCFDYDQTMKYGPAIAYVAALIGDPDRANMLTALMTGKALTVREHVKEAGVTV